MMARENLQKTLRRERQAEQRQRQELDRLMAEHKARHAMYMQRARIAGALIGAGMATARNPFTAEWAGDGAYSKPFSEWTEGMLEGRWAELDGEIEAGSWTGETLASAVRERTAVYQEIIRCRLGGLDDDEAEGGDFDLPDDDDDPVMVPFDCPKRGGACYETACLHWNECRYESLRA